MKITALKQCVVPGCVYNNSCPGVYNNKLFLQTLYQHSEKTNNVSIKLSVSIHLIKTVSEVNFDHQEGLSKQGYG